MLQFALRADHAIAASAVPRLDHVAIILMENHGRDQVIGTSQAPFINQTANQYASADNYYAIGHPSLPNYIALVSGDTQGVADNCEVTQCPVVAKSIGDALDAAGGTATTPAWRAYLEGMASPCLADRSGGYTPHHNPFVYFTSLYADKQRCAAEVVPFSVLGHDLAAGMPRYAFIVPNLCNDTHDCSVATGDTWLAQQVPAILESSSFKQNAVLFIVWDEDDGSGDNKVALIAAGPSVQHGAVSHQRCNHYSLLRTVEVALGLPPLGPNDTAAQPLAELF